MFQTDLGSLDLSYRENVMEQMFGCCFEFACVWESSRWSQTHGNLPQKNDLQANTFKQCVTLSMQDAWKAIFHCGRKSIQ